MTYTSDTILGMPLSEGTAFFVKESAHAEGASAAISYVQLQTSKFAGATARREFIIPQMTSQNYAMQAAENHVPDIRLQMQQFLDATKPSDGLKYLDEMINMFGGTTSAPALRIIPGETFELSAYKAADGLVGAMHGVFTYMGFQHTKPANGSTGIAPYTTIKDFNDLKYMDMDAQKLLWLTPTERESMKDLSVLDDMWRATKHGKAVTDDQAKVIMSKLGVVTKSDGWRSRSVDILPNGLIAVDGVALRPQEVKNVFPHVPYGPKGKYLDDQVRGHNNWAGRGPTRNNLRRITAIDEIIRSNTTSGKEGQSTKATLTIDDVNWQPEDVQGLLEMPGDEYEPQTRFTQGAERSHLQTLETTIRHVQQGKSAMFALTWAGITDYFTVPIEDDDTDDTLADKAWHASYSKHSAIALRRNDAYKRAKILVEARTKAILIESLRPAFAKKLNAIRFELDHSPAPHHIRYDRVTEDNLDDVMKSIGDVVKQYRRDMVHTVQTGTPLDDGFSVIASGRFAPTPQGCVIMMPIVGRGVAPVTVKYTSAGYKAVRPLGVGIVLDEPAVTLGSPVRSMIMTAALFHLIELLNGRGTKFAVDEYDPNNPSGTGHTRPCLRSLLNRQIRRYVQGLSHQISVVTPETIKPLLEKATVLTDAKLFLDHVDELFDAIIKRDDWVYMIQGLMISLLLANGAKVYEEDSLDSDRPRVVSTVSAGIAPPEVTKYLFNEVLKDVIKTEAYRSVAEEAQSRRTLSVPDLTSDSEISRLVRGEVMLARMRKGAEFLITLLDGSEPLCPIVQAGNLQNLVDADYSLDLMKTIATMLNRDYLAAVDAAKSEAPWECAQWATQFSTFAMHIKSSPIEYQARDMAREVVSDSDMPILSAALLEAGFEWTEIAPSAAYVYASGEGEVTPIKSEMYMEGVHSKGGLFNDAPVSQQMMRITTTLPMYDTEAYNLLRAYITTATPRSYWAQPVDTEVSCRYRIIPSADTPDYLAALLGLDADSLDWLHFKKNGFAFEKCPAIADMAILIPYISSFLTKPAITRDVAVHQCITIDKEASLASTSGVTITPGELDTRLISYGNGLAVNMKSSTSVSTALDWIGS